MQRFFAEIAYDGTTFHGWQRQPNTHTVQETVERALGKLHGRDTPVVGCGRTDTGVHASQYFLHFDAQPDRMTPEEQSYKLDRILPETIAVRRVFPVPADLHARFSATHRAYSYFLHFRKEPFRPYSARIRFDLDLDRMNEAAGLLLRQTDFGAFCKAGSDNTNNRCDVRESVWRTADHGLVYSIGADRFLRNMVRAIVGTLIDVGRGFTSVHAFREVLESGDRSKAGMSAPADGLFLSEVRYPFS